VSPSFIEPCRPALREKAPSGGRWIHEIKFDGYRTQAHLKVGRPAIYTRRGPTGEYLARITGHLHHYR
jgi:bifunctional non-homologous end joining protein LigD